MTDEEIEAVARRMCEELGLSPDERVGHGFGADMTPAEIVAYDKSHHGYPAIALFSPRWRVTRAHAAAAIAAHRAVTALPPPPHQIVNEGEG